MGEYGLSQPVPRTEDPRLLRGGGQFVDDVDLAHQAWGYVLRSPHAHARITSLEAGAASRAPGVLAVLTAQDYRAAGLGEMPNQPPPTANWDPAKLFKPPRIPLAEGKVRFVGDGIAYVVAETPAQARDGAELIEVGFEPLDAVTETEKAGEPGQPLIWEDCPNNTAFTFENGDAAKTEAAFAGAAHVVRQRLVISRVNANTLEPRGIVADYDTNVGFCTVYAAVQGAFGLRAQLARVIFGEADNGFRIIVRDIGGSFGMKGAFYPEYALTVWASKRLGRPVKWISDRAEGFLSDNHGRDNVTDAELALDEDGHFLAVRVHTTANLGGYLSTMAGGPPTAHLGGLAGVYRTPAAYVHVKGVFSNTNPTAAYRGAGRPEASYVIERMVDLAAAELGLDAAEIRRRNLVPAGAMPYANPLGFTYDSGDFAKNLEDGLATGDYAGFAARRAEAEARGMLRGIGLSTTIERAAPPGMEHIEIRFDPGGTLTIVAGTTNHGQGHATMYTQIACEYLGVEPSAVRVIEGDTGLLSFGSGTGGSRVSAMGGSAVYLAAGKIQGKARVLAAHLLEAAEADMTFEDGLFTVTGTDKSISMTEVARAAYQPARLPEGMEPGLAEAGIHRSRAANFPNGCHVVEVEVEPETGKVAVLRYVVVDDVGVVINPLLLAGQIHGGVAQGLGQALMEEIRYDPGTGQLLTGAFTDYCMPKAEDLCDIRVEDNPVPTETNPLGVKGAGEAGTIGGLAAVANAVMNALSPLGIRHLDMPLTSERIWRAIRDAQGDVEVG